MSVDGWWSTGESFGADADGVEYRLYVEQDEDDAEGHFASGDDGADAETVAEIRQRLARGDVWAWAMVVVLAKHPACSAVGWELVGACSFKDQTDFETCEGHTFRCEARAHLLERLAALADPKPSEGARALLARLSKKEGGRR